MRRLATVLGRASSPSRCLAGRANHRAHYPSPMCQVYHGAKLPGPALGNLMSPPAAVVVGSGFSLYSFHHSFITINFFMFFFSSLCCLQSERASEVDEAGPALIGRVPQKTHMAQGEEDERKEEGSGVQQIGVECRFL